MNKPVIMIGNGGHANVLTEILLGQGVGVIGFTAPEGQKNQFDLPYLGDDSQIFNHSIDKIELVLGLGSVNQSDVRKNVFRHFKNEGYAFKSVIHSTAIIAPSVKLGEGVQVMAGTILQTNTEIADNTIINTGTIIDHDSRIAAHVHIAPGCALSGNIIIGESSHIGTGTTIIQGIEIGQCCLIGAGAVVLKSISDGMTAYGVPAKEVYK